MIEYGREQSSLREAAHGIAGHSTKCDPDIDPVSTGDLIARLDASTAAMLARVGGMLLATIGTQLLLGGIRDFYEF